MGRITGSWERPIQGVSQQTDKDRINGQCTLQENFIPSPLYGLIKRIGTKHIKLLGHTFHKDSYWYSYNRGSGEGYLVVIEPYSYPQVFDAKGNKQTVIPKDVEDLYLMAANPAKTMRMSTIADYSFILNTDKVVQTLPDKTPKNPNTAILYCQYATYGRDYEVIIDGSTVTKYTTPDGSSAEMVNQVKTNYVIEQLKDNFNTLALANEEHIVRKTPEEPLPYIDVTYDIVDIREISTPYRYFDGRRIYLKQGLEKVSLSITVQYSYKKGVQQYDLEQHGNCLFITRKDKKPFKISTVDSADGNDLVAVQDTVAQLSNLPPYAPEGHVIKIQNKEGFNAASYWLKAELNSTDKTGSRIKWVEATAPDTEYKLDLKTMPHVLVSEGDGTFTLQKGEWLNRQVGNEETNPMPSFIGSVVKSIGTFQNRMVFTSDEAAIFSRTNNFFDFFRETTQQESDSDPIDAYADSDEINNLLHHAVLDGDIVFFAENGQFLIKGDKPITKENLVFKKVTSYPMNTYAKPAVTGESVMFAYNSGSYTGIREMFTDSFTDTKRARPITEHVSEYIVGKAHRLVASPNFNTLLIQADDPSTLYVYDWLWNGDQKVQAAFHKWKFSGDVLYASFYEDELFLVIKRDNGVYLESMPISSDADDNGLDFPVRLDQRAIVDVIWNNNRWEWTTPYRLENLEEFEFVRGDGCWSSDRGTSVIFEGEGDLFYSYDDLSDGQRCKLTLGRKYTSRYIPTQPFLKDQNGRVMGLDRFTLGQVYLNYESIGSISVDVYDKFSKRNWHYEYNGRRMGGWNNRVGFAPLDAGQFAFPVRLPSDRCEFEITTDDYRPFILRDMEWSGMFRQRGRRL